MEKQVAEHNMGIAADQKIVAKTVQKKCEEKSLHLLLTIDQTRALRVRTNQYWPDLIKERLRQHHMHNRR